MGADNKKNKKENAQYVREWTIPKTKKQRNGVESMRGGARSQYRKGETGVRQHKDLKVSEWATQVIWEEYYRKREQKCANMLMWECANLQIQRDRLKK